MSGSRRSGTSLIETLVIMAVGGVIATLAIKLVHESQIRARGAQQALDLQVGIRRLDEQFRRDAREAESIQIPSDGRLELTLADSTVVFAAEKGLITRTETERDTKKVSREGYGLPNSQVTFSQTEDGKARVLVVVGNLEYSSESYLIEQAIGGLP